jgi:hypothetical protein
LPGSKKLVIGHFRPFHLDPQLRSAWLSLMMVLTMLAHDHRRKQPRLAQSIGRS